MICLNRANPLKVPLTISVTIETAKLRLCGVPEMVTCMSSNKNVLHHPGTQSRQRRCKTILNGNVCRSADCQCPDADRIATCLGGLHGLIYLDQGSRVCLQGFDSFTRFACKPQQAEDKRSVFLATAMVLAHVPITRPTMDFGQSTVAVCLFNVVAELGCDIAAVCALTDVLASTSAVKFSMLPNH